MVFQGRRSADSEASQKRDSRGDFRPRESPDFASPAPPVRPDERIVPSGRRRAARQAPARSIHLQRQHLAARARSSRPQASSAVTSIESFRAGLACDLDRIRVFARRQVEHRPIRRLRSAGAGGDLDGLLVDASGTSLPPILPNTSLACPGVGITSAFAAAAGYFCARLTEVSSLLRPSFSTAGPSAEEKASLTWSGLTTARSADFLPSALAEFAAVEGEHVVQFGRNAGLEFPAKRVIAAGHFSGPERAHRYAAWAPESARVGFGFEILHSPPWRSDALAA